ncbi:carbohydrate esterase family 8 protein [Nemania sp. FL0916]|nr:carbohydrate esterase family 8 protein [Nemania sp. FL0916]
MARLILNLLLLIGLSEAIARHTKNIPAQTFRECQKKTANPLSGCPPGTIYVSQTDENANFQSIQGAITSLANDTTSQVILIAPGIYTEQLNVTRQGPLTLLGVSDRPSRRESYADISYNSTHENNVQVYWNSANHDAIFSDNVYTGVLTVGPNLNATLTGSGPTGFPVPEDTPFGCTDFRAYNIEFTPYSNGPAHAVGVSRANAGFYSCGFYSWQDTVYIGKLGNSYFYDTVVAGQTDFLYGFGTLFIQSSSLSLRNCGGGITAWKGTNTTFANKYGVYISDSQLLAANSSIAPTITDKCSLGRPWNELHRSLYINSYFDSSILPMGYTPWSGKPNDGLSVNTTMAVYGVYGPGYDEVAEKASNVTKVFTEREARPYLTPVGVFLDSEGKHSNTKWIDHSVL